MHFVEGYSQDCAWISVSRSFTFYSLFDLVEHLFQDIAPSMDLLAPLLPSNPYLYSLKVDCCRLDDSAIQHFVRPSLHELFLHNCNDCSGKLLSDIGTQCRDLRYKPTITLLDAL